MHDRPAIYEKTLRQVKSVLGMETNNHGNFRAFLRRPSMSDLEVIALALTAESVGISSENLLFSKLKTDYASHFPRLIHLTRFNRRRKSLAPKMMAFAAMAGERASPDCGVHLVDSMPCPLVRNSREQRLRICTESQSHAPAISWSAVDRRYFIGYMLHLVTFANGTFRDMDITPAKVHGINYIKQFTKGHVSQGKVLVGDRGYVSAKVQTSLFDECEITLKVPYRRNQRAYQEHEPQLSRARRRIETLFSQLCDQFNIKVNYAKTFIGLKTRILTKLAALSLLQLINALNNRPLNQLKHAWA